MKTMRAVVFYAPKDIRLVESPVPKPGAGEVLVKVGAALTCGTDFKAYRRGHPVLLGPLPARFGHELAGIVAQVGKGVKDFKEGDAVVAGNSAPCDGCYFCARGQNQLCDRLKLHNGAYADYDLLPPNIVKHNLHKLPSGIELATAALAEPLACAMHAVDLLKVAEGESALIIGAGSMSLLLIQALFARKARVLVVGRGRANLDLAQAAGAHDVFSVEDGDALTWARGQTEGRGPDCVFEAVGLPGTWQQAIALVRKGGRVCLFGGCAPGLDVPVDAHRIHYSQLSLFGVFHHTPKYFKAAVELLGSGAVRPDLLIAGSIPLSDVCSFYDRQHGVSNQKMAVIP